MKKVILIVWKWSKEKRNTAWANSTGDKVMIFLYDDDEQINNIISSYIKEHYMDELYLLLHSSRGEDTYKTIFSKDKSQSVVFIQSLGFYPQLKGYDYFSGAMGIISEKVVYENGKPYVNLITKKGELNVDLFDEVWEACLNGKINMGKIKNFHTTFDMMISCRDIVENMEDEVYIQEIWENMDKNRERVWNELSKEESFNQVKQVFERCKNHLALNQMADFQTELSNLTTLLHSTIHSS